ncbi:MAG TPA: peptidyl-prolyl cis-trans isomerase [Vicinamibacteria bacterium]|nr:peptidyl-prolyl cis-trans isomerase [Vicinamibacteria bacterium]
MPTRPVLVLVTIAALAGCGERRRPAAAGASGVVATVNGVALTDRDLEHRAKGAAMAGAPGHEAAAANVLETLVRDELVAQKAVELGLDRDEEYRRKVRDLEAQLHAFQRQQLAVLLRGYVQEHAAVTEAEARAWFEKNADSIRTKLHVLQILRKGDYAEIVRDREDVKAGTPFEEVAARRFPGLPASVRAPWDLGELHWSQLPPAWRGVVDRLEPGQVSNVIQGDGERYWVVKLAGKRVDPAISFETEKARIAELLRQQKATELYDRTLAEAKAKADVSYSKAN